MSVAYIGLGSNLGDRATVLDRAVELLAAVGPVRRSQWYETEPVGLVGVPHFLNGVAEVQTELEPAELLVVLGAIEQRLGRDRTAMSGSRAADLDLLLHDSRVVSTPVLTLPHPRMHERAFVLVPLAELAAGLVHPTLGRTMLDLLGAVDRSGVRPWKAA